jgi:hypothetical protein
MGQQCTDARLESSVEKRLYQYARLRMPRLAAMTAHAWGRPRTSRTDPSSATSSISSEDS